MYIVCLLGHKSFFQCYCSDDAYQTGEQNVNLNKNTSDNVASIKIQTFIVKEILFEISFIKQMRITSGNKEVPQVFFHNSLICENTIYFL